MHAIHVAAKLSCLQTVIVYHTSDFKISTSAMFDFAIFSVVSPYLL
jgi:hypothetical protein